ncbi:hypothetical protein B7486_28975 [cyanobacterium TDX16]|nr:hypothetical protein B7486_28975 [cyanobacterium TDX16]
MIYYKRMTYVAIGDGFQTYIYPACGTAPYIRYKLLPNRAELDEAVEKCQNAGWKVMNGTNISKLMLSVTPKRSGR